MIYNETRYNSHWNTKKLLDLGVFARGKSKHRPRDDERLFEGGGYPLIQTGEVKAANLYITKHEQEYGEFGLAQSKLWDAGTLCITIAANIAETAILSYPMCFPDSVVGFRAYPEESSELFMHYVFTYIRNSIQNSVSGSIQDNINIDYLSQLDFKVPDKAYQDKVVGILGAIDQKIDTNNRTCEELEAMAKTIYDYWFTQFDFPDADGNPYRSSGGAMEWNEQLKRNIPQGWSAKNIQTVCSIVDCLHSQKPKHDFVAEKYYLLQLENLVNLGLVDLKSRYYVSEEMYNLWTSRIEVQDGDLVVTNAGRVGAVSRIPNYVTAGIGRNMTAIRPERIPAFFLYYFFRSPDFSVQMRANTDAGAFFGSLNVRGIKQLMLTIPHEDSDILVQFDSVVGPIRRKIEALQLENEELTKLRDWLLPMLMNGQVTVAE